VKARAWLLRESFRQDGKVHNRTLANLSHWPPEQIEALRQVLKGDYRELPTLESAFEITRSLPHGHVAAVLWPPCATCIWRPSSTPNPAVTATGPWL
jgi:hypothetical protein